LYHIDDINQESISRKLKILRYKVSRMLKKVKDNGLVRIQVLGPEYKESISKSYRRKYVFT